MKRQLTVKELQTRELEILQFFHNFCEQHNLRYSLYAGSLIGAVRHKGFIPWDDDIDVAMPRKDYMRLIELYKAIGFGKYKLSSPYTEPDCPITFGKIYETDTLKMSEEVKRKYCRYGADIDIFPFDYASESYEERMKLYKKQYALFKIFGGLVGECTKRGSIVKRIERFLYITFFDIIARVGILKPNKIALKINENAMAHIQSKVVQTIVFPSLGGPKAYSDISDFEERMLVPFENKMFYIPKGYDNLLTHIYGDYMKLPPVEDQVAKHLSSTYLIDEVNNA